MNKKIFGNPYIHLTNYSINKHNKHLDFSEKKVIKTKDQTSTKWTFKQLKEYFQKENLPYDATF